MPYDVNQANYGDKGYAGYRVASSVVNHSSFGAGVYHYFRDNHVVVHAGIVAPPHLEDSFVSPLSVFLNGKGVIKHVINDKGGLVAVSVFYYFVVFAGFVVICSCLVYFKDKANC
ncbi:unnamed protein product [Polarella glacialis]|uniref:Uncharacterized protein n=1 Tax=Polarella glacialis TaxID=89957 RepID=A0A813ET30_POLGL|nr:unnamed protein product [Polarella glacialis]